MALWLVTCLRLGWTLRSPRTVECEGAAQMKRQLLNTVLVAIILSLIGLSNAKAQAEPQPGAAGPEPGVARISLIQGDVSTQRGDSGEWVAATQNTPLESGDSVSTGNGSSAEIQLDYANVLRLDQGSVVRIADLVRNHIQVQVSQGLIEFSVFKGTEANVEIDAPSVSVEPAGEGQYRIEVASPTETRVTVRKGGEAQISTPQGSAGVRNNEMITVEGTTEDAQFRVDPAPGPDDWDQWNSDRDHAILSARSWSHTNQYYTGSQDLDRYGQWENVPGYGDVWQPSGEGPDWAPYRDGRWEWEPYYGWTWVSYEPWGWAPYHYGRWFLRGSSWLWWPGRLFGGYRPMWAPAYVSFFGLAGRGLGFGLGLAWDAIGWLATGPLDFFHPWWGGGGRSVNVTNITSITDIRNRSNAIAPLMQGNRPGGSNLLAAFNNSRVRQGITAVDQKTFVGGRVPAHPQPVGLEQFKQGRMSVGRLPVVPTRDSLRPTKVDAKPSSIPRQGAVTQHFFSRNHPAAGPVPFNQRQAQIQQAVRQGSTAGAGARFAQGQRPGQSPFVSAGRPGVGGNPVNRASTAASGWRRFAQPAPNGSSQGQFRGGIPPGRSVAGPRQQQPQSSGWQRFASRPGGSQLGAGGRSSEWMPRQSSGGYNRPPLQLNRPIMNQRAPSNSGGYRNSAPRNNGGGYSVPWGGGGGGGYRAPSGRGYSAPRGGGGYSAPRGGGGGYRAPRGGGGRSAPRGGGGSRGGGGGRHSGSSHSGKRH